MPAEWLAIPCKPRHQTKSRPQLISPRHSLKQMAEKNPYDHHQSNNSKCGTLHTGPLAIETYFFPLTTCHLHGWKTKEKEWMLCINRITTVTSNPSVNRNHNCILLVPPQANFWQTPGACCKPQQFRKALCAGGDPTAPEPFETRFEEWCVNK